MTPNPYPFMNVPSPPPKAATRRRMGVEECTVCGLAVEYCRGHAPPEQGASDGSDSDLVRRVRECRGGR